MTVTTSCAAPDQAAAIPTTVDLSIATVITGVVLAGESPVQGAYVRLLDSGDDFAAEVVTSADGVFRFFAAPGSWTLRVLSRAGSGTAGVIADRGVTAAVLTVD